MTPARIALLAVGIAAVGLVLSTSNYPHSNWLTQLSDMRVLDLAGLQYRYVLVLAIALMVYAGFLHTRPPSSKL